MSHRNKRSKPGEASACDDHYSPHGRSSGESKRPGAGQSRGEGGHYGGYTGGGGASEHGDKMAAKHAPKRTSTYDPDKDDWL